MEVDLLAGDDDTRRWCGRLEPMRAGVTFPQDAATGVGAHRWSETQCAAVSKQARGDERGAALGGARPGYSTDSAACRDQTWVASRPPTIAAAGAGPGGDNDAEGSPP
ncbi:hypothetical protein GCM10020218_086440 [Dactylosporangium vinaceum]